jgi:hypothetical protein
VDVTGLAPRRRGILPAAFAVLAFGIPAGARAGGFQIFENTTLFASAGTKAQFGLAEPAAELFDGRGGADVFRLDLRFPAEPVPLDLPSPLLADQPRPPRRFWVGVVSVGAVAGSAFDAFTDSPKQSYHFSNEGWFGESTYVGGGDKASHFVSYYAVSRLLNPVYGALGVSESRSNTLASAVSVLAGLATELGDGTTVYGFSWQDVVMNSLGAASAFVLTRYDLNDMIGFRVGLVPAPEIPACCAATGGKGKDYSKEIYTADFKLAGLARRLNRDFGPARFLLAGVTYGTKGYQYAEEQYRERQVGFEVGLNIAEIARAVGVPEHKWWGAVLLTILDFVRLPYTAIVFSYDMNRGQWKKPSTGGTKAFPYQ